MVKIQNLLATVLFLLSLIIFVSLGGATITGISAGDGELISIPTQAPEESVAEDEELISIPEDDSTAATTTPGEEAISIPIESVETETKEIEEVQEDEGLFGIAAAPTHIQPRLNSTTVSNLSEENITCYNLTTADGDGDTVTNIYNWYKDNVSTMVLNMPFDHDDSGGVNTTKDYSGRANHGQLGSSADGDGAEPTWTSSGQVGGAYSFDGGDYIFAPAFSYGSAFSIGIWAKPSDVNGAEILIVKKTSGAVESVQIFINGDDIYARVYSADNVWIGRLATAQLTTDWQYFTFVYDGGTTSSAVKIYRNSIQVDDSNSQSGSFSSFNDLNIITEIGAQNSGAQTHFSGTIDEVKVYYNTALSTVQIHQLYLDTKDGHSSNATIVSNETAIDDTWICEITPNDGTSDGTARNSSVFIVKGPETPCSITNLTQLMTPLNCTTLNISSASELNTSSYNITVTGLVSISGTLNGGNGSHSFGALTIESGGKYVTTNSTTTFTDSSTNSSIIGNFSIGSGNITDLRINSTQFNITGGADIEIHDIITWPANPASTNSSGKYLNITNTSTTSSMLLNVSYMDWVPIFITNISLYKYNTSWHNISGIHVDTTNNWTSKNITHFSLFGIFEEVPERSCSITNSTQLMDNLSCTILDISSTGELNASSYNITTTDIVRVSGILNGGTGQHTFDSIKVEAGAVYNATTSTTTFTNSSRNSSVIGNFSISYGNITNIQINGTLYNITKGVNLELYDVITIPVNPTDTNSSGKYLNITNTSATSSALLNISYIGWNPTFVTNVSLYKYNTSWHNVSGIFIDAINNWTSKNITRFSLFGLFENTPPIPDLLPTKIDYSPLGPITGTNVTINVTISEIGGVVANNFNVSLYIDDVYQAQNIISIASNAENSTNFTWIATSELHEIKIAVDSARQIVEDDEDNNNLTRMIGADWPTFGQTVDRISYSSATGMPVTNTTHWIVIADDDIQGSPSVANNMVYVVSKSGILYALNATNSSEIWQYGLGSGLFFPAASSSPTVYKDIVYVGSDNMANFFYAINATNGTRIWTFTADDTSNTFAAVADDMVYTTDNSGNLYGLNATNGSQIWKNTDASDAGGSTYSDDIVYFGGGGGGSSWIYAMNATNGTQIWNYSTTSSGAPTVYNDIIYTDNNAAGQERIYGLNATNGSHIWNYSLPVTTTSTSIAVANDMLHFGGNNRLWAINATNGSHIWNQSTFGDTVASPPAVAGDIVYIGSDNSDFYAINATNGSVIWNYNTQSTIRSSPAIGPDNIVYVGSYDNGVYAFGPDATKPNVTYDIPPTPEIDVRLHSNSVTINVSVTDDNGIDACVLEIGGVNITMNKTGSGTTATCTATVSTVDGQAYSYKVHTNDTSGLGNVSTTQNFTENTVPNITTVNITPISPFASDNLTCNVISGTDDEGDVLSYYYEWYKDGALNLTIENTTSTSHVLYSGNISEEDNWYCLVIPHDGYENGTSITKFKTILIRLGNVTTITGGLSGGAGGAQEIGVDLTSTTYVAIINANTLTIIEITRLPNLPPTSVGLTLSEDATAVEVTATALSTKPATISIGPSGTVYKYFDVTTTNIEETQVASATIDFKVEQDWVSRNNIDESTIRLARYSEGNWVPLETKQINEDDEYLYFEAETPGFSTFVVIAERLAEVTEEPREVRMQLPKLPEIKLPEIKFSEKTINLTFFIVVMILLIGLLTRKYYEKVIAGIAIAKTGFLLTRYHGKHERKIKGLLKKSKNTYYKKKYKLAKKQARGALNKLPSKLRRMI